MFEFIDLEGAKALVDGGEATVVDIRSPWDYEAGHIEGALHVVDQASAEHLVTHSDKEQPLLVYCYHGNSSQQAAYFFAQQGFEKVYSMNGGFEAWRQLYPHTGSTG